MRNVERGLQHFKGSDCGWGRTVIKELTQSSYSEDRVENVDSLSLEQQLFG